MIAASDGDTTFHGGERRKAFMPRGGTQRTQERTILDRVVAQPMTSSANILTTLGWLWWLDWPRPDEDEHVIEVPRRQIY